MAYVVGELAIQGPWVFKGQEIVAYDVKFPQPVSGAVIGGEAPSFPQPACLLLSHGY